MSKTIFILSGISGSGKSTLAANLSRLMSTPDDYPYEYESKPVMCCADDYFTNKFGEYNFDATKLGAAHAQCQEKFKKCVDEELPNIIVANTNLKQKDFQIYVDYGKENGYTIFNLMVLPTHGQDNVHGVPKKTIERQVEKTMNMLSNIYGEYLNKEEE